MLLKSRKPFVSHNTVTTVINPKPFTLVIRSAFYFNSLSSSTSFLISASISAVCFINLFFNNYQ
ncbi:hypothetical protein Barb6_02286 [Bacteroidales bacterium Barb6]|nr:hypothetical protein Barb6_02286 [Bacteroidales bacterium Barb6]